MKSKYVMISGLAFSEKSDMEKLENYASEGWILEDIVGGFFYKLKKDKPQNIIYSLDYQGEADEEYFAIFKEAGWNLVVSVENQMHIFSASVGTKPIYSDLRSEVDKYISIKNQTKRGTLYSLIIGIVLMGLLPVSSIVMKPIFLGVVGLLIIDLIIFVFNFLPYLSYSSKIKQIKKEGKCKSETMSNKFLWKIYGVGGILLIPMGIVELIERKYPSAIFLLIFGISNLFSSLSCYKKYKKSL
ncbi:DUF2812 domain-containing protein [Hathewaya massiliensis]|uniref:DUF2812 domain-containing protein n=1 Tax=Hathewaya massiliensis TaxID=1964382 RepID=UPI0011593CD8|nr:DUF2812 domain-containing protein [Hathewaya massiliensis]